MYASLNVRLVNCVLLLNALNEIVISDLFVSDAKRIFGRSLVKDGDKWIFDTSSPFWF